MAKNYSLAHDNDGFLLGKVVNIDSAKFDKAVDIWHLIRQDTSAIKNAVESLSRGSELVSRVSEPKYAGSSSTAKAAYPVRSLPERGADGRFVKSGEKELSDAVSRAIKTASSVTPSTPSITVANPIDKPVSFVTQSIPDVAIKPTVKSATPERGINGRFVSKKGYSGEEEKVESNKQSAIASKISDAADSLKNAASGLSSIADGTENIDPAIAATKEVKDMLSPVASTIGGAVTGVFGLFKKKDPESKAIPWYRRIWSELKGINGKQGNSSGFLAMLLSAIAGLVGLIAGLPGNIAKSLLGSLGRLFGGGPRLPTSAGGGAGSSGGAGGAGIPEQAQGKAGGGVWGKVKGFASNVGKTIKGGAPIAALMAGFDMFSTENDDSLTRSQKNDKHVKTVGGAAGSLAGGAVGAEIGAAIGTVIFPGVGTAIGAALGGLTGGILGFIGGDTLGDWVNDLRHSDVAGKIVDSWNDLTDWFKDKLSTISNFLGSAWDKTKQVAQPVTTAIKEGAGKAWEGTKNVVTSAKDWVLGKTSKFFESGNKGAAAVSTGAGDAGGASYGTYQLASKTGTLDKFLKSSGYGDQFKGLTPGSAEFNKKWKDVAASDPKFESAQHDFIKQTHFDPALKGLNDSGIDLSKRGAAVQDALWSTSVQFGAGDVKKNNGAIGIFNKALAGKDVSKLSDAEIVSAVQDYKIANNDKLFSSSSDSVRAGTLNRASSEKQRLLALDAATKNVSPTNVSYSDVTANKAPAVAATPQIETPKVSAAVSVDKLTPPPAPSAPMQQLNSSSDDSKQVSVNIPRDLTQNPSDRGVAQIVTGGLGSYTFLR